MSAMDYENEGRGYDGVFRRAPLAALRALVAAEEPEVHRLVDVWIVDDFTVVQPHQIAAHRKRGMQLRAILAPTFSLLESILACQSRKSLVSLKNMAT
ncbi:MAG: hypothetical protein M1819_006432 [Sarea resinae]|nr:MAG: hypothetical protein M1819_006432 [Sarea resinae]